MTNQTKSLLLIGLALVVVGLFKPDVASWINRPSPVSVDVMELPEPTDPTLKKEADDIVVVLKESKAIKSDSKKLRDLYLDIAKLIELDGEDLVIKNTEEIRQANSISGVMLKLDIKGKYPNLAKEAKEVIVSAVGDDSIVLSSELRAKAVEAFNALAWACNEGVK